MSLKEKFTNVQWYFRVLIFAIAMLAMCAFFAFEVFEKISKEEIIVRASIVFLIYIILGYLAIQKNILQKGWFGRGMYNAIFFFTLINAGRPTESFNNKFLLINIPVYLVVALLLSFLMRKYNNRGVL